MDTVKVEGFVTPGDFWSHRYGLFHLGASPFFAPSYRADEQTAPCEAPAPMLVTLMWRTNAGDTPVTLVAHPRSGMIVRTDPEVISPGASCCRSGLHECSCCGGVRTWYECHGNASGYCIACGWNG